MASTRTHPPIPLMDMLDRVLHALAASEQFSKVPGGNVEIRWQQQGHYRVTIDLNPWLDPETTTTPDAS